MVIKVAHCIRSLSPQFGGPPRSVTGLTEHLAAQGDCTVTLITQSICNGEIFAADTETRVERRIAFSRSQLALKFGLPMRRMLYDVVAENTPSILHYHGLWLPHHHHVAVAARTFQIPLVTHPRGTLEPWALDYRGWKKRLALYTYERRNLETAVLLFATGEQEAESMRRLGLRQPIAIIPNGVVLPTLQSSVDGALKLRPGPRVALFLSRIHPKKGLLNLVESWSRLRPLNWRLCLAGPDEDGHLAVVMRRVRELGLETVVDYLGEVEGETKANLFAKADVFVLPSFSENFGIVVAEALASGLPVITTVGTPWRGLERHGCGWCIEPTVDALTCTLREALELDVLHLKAMGECGREYAREFDWTHIALQTSDVYHWILGRRSMPACVYCD
ncbi:glycosyltransferase [Thiocapsa bogorovii]|uniref:glycosyltransferase n=1 Tax=Thiocapsa bogorovii TaxID=521689 RepID=UPI001E298436|nr:glycosyltransferase [Thiocapsa bogorovii]UHD15468.1 glycosyltransferase [Thiocapsa bogorovii]